MKILVVGGTGMIGGHAAGHLAAEGHEVVLAARRPPGAETPMAKFPVVIGDYVRGDFSEADLAPYDAILFAAGNDIRHLPRGSDQHAFWNETQIAGVPAFIARARDAGVKRVVHIGSYYHQVMPHLADTDPYVRARKLADEKSRALATKDFNVSTLNPPSIIGAIPGLASKRYETLIAYARGDIKSAPLFAPPGGTNYMSVQSLSEAIAGAFVRAESGKAYLIGDENWSFQKYFQSIFDAVGNPHQLEMRDAEHPLLPDAFIIPGRGVTLAYEPDPAETKLLGYRRNDAGRALKEAIAIAQSNPKA
ncbi:NAD(P)-dependent oxidoreductase [Terrarubrum flagellatum]|uniref:NAD-dependent epimerase/dehydratase family protein n=1 Tax=Terrirubrum flagellatum TaxID=2895980 RepID=UPI0031451D7A